MPYALTFKKTLPALDERDYINRCCIGGDLVVDRLLPAVTTRYREIQSNQEDWGWFIWMKSGVVDLAIDIHTEDEVMGGFRIHLTSRVKRWGLFTRVEDTPELEQLRTEVIAQLESWVDSAITTTHLDREYM
jgi:hypothetical protein